MQVVATDLEFDFAQAAHHSDARTAPLRINIQNW